MPISPHLNDARCTEAGGNQGDHDLVVFKDGGSSSHPNYWGQPVL